MEYEIKLKLFRTKNLVKSSCHDSNCRILQSLYATFILIQELLNHNNTKENYIHVAVYCKLN